MAVVRLFRCGCGHKLRLNSRICRRCYSEAPVRNLLWPWVTGACILAGIVAMVSL